MSEKLSYCGLVCDTCPIYLATRVVDLKEQTRMRVEIARFCREQYGMKYEQADITDCDGCRVEGGRLFSGCRTCAIRKCAGDRGVENCAHCAEYVCGKLETFFASEPTAKTRLDEVKSRIA
jgi:hypothetical protein